MPVFRVDYTVSSSHSVNIEADNEEEAYKLAIQHAAIDHGTINESSVKRLADNDTVHYPYEKVRG